LINFFKTTKYYSNYWKNRKIDWQKSYQNFDHPHRFLISAVLKSLDWLSLIEIGCGGCANLINIVKCVPGKQVGGVDVNPEAIKLANETFRGGLFKVNSADNIMLSDKSTDCTLSDMMYIYVTPRDINKYIKELKRITRKYVILCEFHSTNWWNRLALRFNSGYNAYNYQKLLGKFGFYDIALYKVPPEAWPGGEPQKTFCYIIVAKVPKR